MNVAKVVDKITLESCIPIDLVKSVDDDYFSLVHNIMTKAYVDLDKTNPAYLVKVMKCRADVIRIKRRRGKIWSSVRV